MKTFLNYFIPSLLSVLIFAFFYAFTKIQNKHQPKQVEDIIEKHIVGKIKLDEFEYEPLSTETYALYYYEPFEIGEHSDEIANIAWRLEHPTVETSHYTLNVELQERTKVLNDIIDTLNIDEPLKIQIGWIITHTYRITPLLTDLPSLTFTKSFKTDINYENVQEIFQSNKLELIKRRDEIITKAFEAKKRC